MQQVLVHPYRLLAERNLCAFCGHQSRPVITHPVKEDVNLGWRVCSEETCQLHFLWCQAEHYRRQAGRHLGNSREPIVMSDSSDED
jgi:hypothetical protein